MVLVGDLNSDPYDVPVTVPEGYPIPFDVLYPPYQVFAGAGYTDTWSVRKGRRDSGETCCHNELLDNPKKISTSALTTCCSATATNRLCLGRCNPK